ncbi:MAG: hypothetical protein U1E89_23960 [Burkholderiaceae bacterium]
MNGMVDNLNRNVLHEAQERQAVRTVDLPKWAQKLVDNLERNLAKGDVETP